MSDKILGFKNKDSTQDNHKLFFEEVSLVVPKSKTFPAISYEWLDKWCSKNYRLRDHDRGLVWVDKLLADAKKEAEA